MALILLNGGTEKTVHHLNSEELEDCIAVGCQTVHVYEREITQLNTVYANPGGCEV
jgi:hypothetical protein